MARITIKRPDGSTESVITYDSSSEARSEVKIMREKIKAAGATGWTVSLRVFK